MQFNPLIPELYVSDLDASLDFYIGLLGFRFEYGRENPRFAFLSYHGSQLMLQQREPSDNHTGTLEHPYGRGINFQIETPDIEAVADRLVRHGHPLRRELTEYWRQTTAGILSGTREIQVLDPDGYYLRFAQELGARPVMASPLSD
jgi:catechol 2,3-dioxygenase-like lactoylglutathione lyase family enzyme